MCANRRERPQWWRQSSKQSRLVRRAEVAALDGRGLVVAGARFPSRGRTRTQVGYVELTDTPFQHSMECATTTITTPPRILCGGGVQPLDEAVSVTSTVGGVQVQVGDATSQLYRLPEGLDVPDCCLGSCCPGGE